MAQPAPHWTNDEFLAILNDVNGEWYVEDTSLL